MSDSEIDIFGVSESGGLINKSQYGVVREWRFVGDKTGMQMRVLEESDIEGVKTEMRNHYLSFQGLSVGVFDNHGECVGLVSMRRSELDDELVRLNIRYVNIEMRNKGVGRDLREGAFALIEKLDYKGVEGEIMGAYKISGIFPNFTVNICNSKELTRERSDMVGGVESLMSHLKSGPLWILPEIDFKKGVSVGADGQHVLLNYRYYFDLADVPEGYVCCNDLSEVTDIVKSLYEVEV